MTHPEPVHGAADAGGESRLGAPQHGASLQDQGKVFDATVLAMASLAEPGEAGNHILRIQYYVRALAQKLKVWQLESDDVALVIGGPDGLDPAFRKAAHERIRLSDLTLPHAFARVLLIEQLYRAWSINAGHPYHRE